MTARLLFFSLASVSAAAAPCGTVVEADVAVRMRDGVTLRADVWRPAGPGPFPVLVYRTPYGRKRAPEENSTFAGAVARGYAVVIQDVRGRYGSEGEFVPYRHEGRDGYDTIEWAATRPWSSGLVGTFGLSYPGAVQWLAAVESPPHLKAMVPAMCFSTPRNFFSSGGVFDLSWPAWIWNNIAPDTRVRKGIPGPRSGEEARAEWARLREGILRRLPLTDVPELREVAPYYFEWMSHPPGDPWWEWCEIRGKYDRVRAAVLNLSGWHDEAYGPEGALTNFLGLRAARVGEADARAQLVIGPWVHGADAVNDRSPQARSGDRLFGAAAGLDYDELILGFMDHHLRGLAGGVEKPVRVFVMGENAWREAGSWPLPGMRPTPVFLSGAAAPGRPRRLVWNVQDVHGDSSTLVSDPANPVVDPYATEPGAHDYRDLPKRADVLAFESEPLARDLTVVGPIAAEVHLSADAPDADLWVKLFDAAPDGTAFNLMSPGLDVLRASYRDGGPERKLLVPGRAEALRLENLMTGNTFKKGHRILVVIAPSFFPHFSRNLHTGELETTSSAMRTATLTVHHSARRPSRLILPVVPR